jgi:CheY-like chemotaxis protein
LRGPDEESDVALLETGLTGRSWRFPGGPRDQHVLLIEDFSDARETIAELLETLGYSVTAVADGLQARTVPLPPDIILTDIGLPDGDGCMLVQALRARDGWRDVPVVAISGYSDPEDLERAQQAGIAEYLVKPVCIQDLDRALQLAVG